MVKKIIFAVLMVALIAMPAFAAVQSVKVSGSLDSTWIVRDEFGLGVATADDDHFYQNLLITQAIVRIDADLTDNVSVVTELINERPWGDNLTTGTTTENAQNDIDLNLAYVQLREFLYCPLSVTIGRQHLRYGNQMIIGDGQNNATSTGGLNGVAEDFSKRTAFDAVKMVLDYNPLTIDVFASKVDAEDLTGTTEEKDDVDLYGINANWKLGDERNTSLEAYFFAKLDSSNNPGNAYVKQDRIYVPGIRVSSNPVENLSTSAEVAWQKGRKALDTAGGVANFARDAMAAQVNSSYALPFEKTKKYSPVLFGSYLYASGDQNPDDARDSQAYKGSEEVYTAWDPMYENLAGGTIYNTLFDVTNCHVYTLGVQGSPIEDVTAKLSWTNLYFAKKIETNNNTPLTMRQPDGTTASEVMNNDQNQIGSELDIDLTYNYTDDVTLGFSSGWFFPGNAFNDNNDDVAKQFITKVGVNW